MLGEYDAAPGEHTKRILRSAIEQAERLLAELAEEREKLTMQLSATTISDKFINDVTRYAERMDGKLENATFAKKRKLVETLGLYGMLTIENGEKVVRLKWHTHEFTLYLENTASTEGRLD